MLSAITSWLRAYEAERGSAMHSPVDGVFNHAHSHYVQNFVDIVNF